MANQQKIASTPVFILAGGRGTRIAEETHAVPKPMIEIGDLPILVHIMRWYYSHGFNDFVICGGYKAWLLKQYFLTYEFQHNHLLFDHRTDPQSSAKTFGHNPRQEKWRVRVIDTGLDCMTGGRIARAFDEIAAEQQFENFAITYGDGVSDVNLAEEFDFHTKHGQIGTVLGVPPLARFGELDISGDQVSSFLEKPQSRQGVINGGFFFMKREFRKYLEDKEECILERAPVAKLAEDGQLKVFRHTGFWQPMDTLRDKQQLQELIDKGKAPWIPQTR